MLAPDPVSNMVPDGLGSDPALSLSCVTMNKDLIPLCGTVYVPVKWEW